MLTEASRTVPCSPKGTAKMGTWRARAAAAVFAGLTSSKSWPSVKSTRPLAVSLEESVPSIDSTERWRCVVTPSVFRSSRPEIGMAAASVSK